MPSKRKRARTNAPQVSVLESHPLIGNSHHAGPSQSTRNIVVPTQSDNRGRLHQVTEHSATAFNWDGLPDLTNILAGHEGEDEDMPGTVQDTVDNPPLPDIDDDEREIGEADTESVRRTVSSKLIHIVNISCIDYKI